MPQMQTMQVQSDEGLCCTCIQINRDDPLIGLHGMGIGGEGGGAHLLYNFVILL